MILLLNFHQFPVKLCSLDYLCQWWNRTYRLRSCKDDRNSKKQTCMLINLWSFHRFYFFKEKWVWRFSHRIHILIRLIQVHAGKIQTVQNGTELKVSPCFPVSHHHFLKITTTAIVLTFSFSYFSQIFKLKNICIYMCVYTINSIQHVAILLYKIYSWPLDNVGVGAPTLHEEENLHIIYSQLSLWVVPPYLRFQIFGLNGLPWWLSGKESACQCRRCGFNPWVRKIPWRRKGQPTPVFLPGKSHG